MRTILLLCLLVLPAACGAPGSPAGIGRPPVGSPSGEQRSPETVASPVPRVASPTSVEPAARPTLASSVLLKRWDAGRRRYEILPVDPATGQAVPEYTPIVVGENVTFTAPHVLSADGRRLAFVVARGQSCESIAGGTACRASADALGLLDLPAWRQVTVPLPGKGWAGPLAFSPDTARVALAYHEGAASVLLLFDAATGTPGPRRALDFRPSLLAYTGDGTALVVYGQPLGADPGVSKPDPPRVLLLDAATLEVRWEQTLAELVSGHWCRENCTASHEQRVSASWTPAVVPAPDGRRLSIVHADADRLTTVDLAARTVRTTEIRAARSWVDTLLARTAAGAAAKGDEEGAFKAAARSPDGRRLYVVGWKMQSTPATPGAGQSGEESLGLQVVEAESGRKIASRDGEATQVDVTPDGAHLLLEGWSQGGRWTEVLDARTLERVARLDQWELVAGRRLDGEALVLASQPGQQATQLAILDPRSFTAIHSWSVDTYATWVTGP